ncbi:hypothetical protein [Rhodococcoides fascians]|uniref:hypothetical protein n=1 Tax=Rhodococcoides fascians TaxID=1828 RepID=UPI0005600DCC|nr:hypothetical protein [Rhodococcus fascians]
MMDEETYAAAINRAAEALHADLQSDDRAYRDDITPLQPLADHTVDYQERVYRTATVIVDALVPLLPNAGTVNVTLPQPIRDSADAAVYDAGENMPAVRVEGGIVRYGAQSYWNISKGDSPAELASALLAAEQHAKAAR